jgi:hypothetical protein
MRGIDRVAYTSRCYRTQELKMLPKSASFCSYLSGATFNRCKKLIIYADGLKKRLRRLSTVERRLKKRPSARVVSNFYDPFITERLISPLDCTLTELIPTRNSLGDHSH